MLDQFKVSWDSLVDKMGGWIDALVLNLPNLLLATVILVASLFAARYVKKGVSKAINRATNNGTVVGVLSNFITAIFLVVSLFLILGVLNLDKALTSLLAGAGVLGLAVGLALQDPMINLFSGILMSVRDYYKVGDLIETNGFFGNIQKINLRSTILIKPDGQEVIIPNKNVLQNPLTNFSHNGRRRIEVSCGIAYGDDLKLVESVVREAIENETDYDSTCSIDFFYTEFGSSSINFKVRYWQNCTAQKDFLTARHKGIMAIKKAFDEKGITIPFPIRTLDFGVVGGLPLNEVQMKVAHNNKKQQTKSLN